MKTLILKPAAIEKLVKAEEAENERAAFWRLVPLNARMVCMMIVRQPRERASDELDAFEPHERRAIAGAITALTSHLEIAKRCMLDTAPEYTELLH